MLPPAVQMSEYAKYGDGAVAMPGGIATGSHPIMLEVAPPQQPAAEEEKNDLQQPQIASAHAEQIPREEKARLAPALPGYGGEYILPTVSRTISFIGEQFVDQPIVKIVSQSAGRTMCKISHGAFLCSTSYFKLELVQHWEYRFPLYYQLFCSFLRTFSPITWDMLGYVHSWFQSAPPTSTGGRIWEAVYLLFWLAVDISFYLFLADTSLSAFEGFPIFPLLTWLYVFWRFLCLRVRYASVTVMPRVIFIWYGCAIFLGVLRTILLKDATLHDELHERCFGGHHGEDSLLDAHSYSFSYSYEADDHERRLQQKTIGDESYKKTGAVCPEEDKFDCDDYKKPSDYGRCTSGDETLIFFGLILFIGASLFHKCWCFAKETRTAYSDANFANRKIKALRMTISVLDERALLGGNARYIRYTTWASLEDIAHFEGLFARVDNKVNHDAISNLKSLSTIYNLKSLAPLSNVLGIPGVNVPVPTAATNEPTTGAPPDRGLLNGAPPTTQLQPAVPQPSSPANAATDAELLNYVDDTDSENEEFTPTEVSFSLSEPLGIDMKEDNLNITGVVPGAQAQRNGVAPGSRIVAVDGVAVNSYAEFMARRQARIDAGAATLALRFVDSAHAAEHAAVRLATKRAKAEESARAEQQTRDDVDV